MVVGEWLRENLGKEGLTCESKGGRRQEVGSVFTDGKASSPDAVVNFSASNPEH